MNLNKILLNNFYKIIIAFTSGSFGVLSFAPYNLWFMSIISFILLLTIIKDCNSCKASYLGFIWGLGLFFTGINWVLISIRKYGNLSYILSVIILAILIIYLSIYPSIFSFFLVKLCPKNNFYRLVIYAPTFWLITESLRGYIMTGFPWLEFGYSQIDGPLKGIAPIFGVRAITFFLAMISGLIIFELNKYKIPLFSILILFILQSLNSFHWYVEVTKKSINISLVQGNISNVEKWKKDKISSILKTYLDKTLPIIGKVQLVIWPESAIPDLEIKQKKFLTFLDEKLKKKNTCLITGIIGTKFNSNEYKYYNSIISLGRNSGYQDHLFSINRYDKHHLVPFGETNIIKISLIKKLMSFLFNNSLIYFSSGKYLQPQIELANVKFTPTICYEIIFGNQIRDNLCQDTDFLLTLSDDAWFDNSIGPLQHFQIARMRSLELGKPLICSSNNGITAVVNADGTVKAQLPQFICAVLNVKVNPTKGLTPYAKNGYKPLWTLIFSILAITKIINYYRVKNITH